MGNKNYPFAFSTEASINLADDDELLDLMIEAGFVTVFIGIETTEEASLAECGKTQNKNRSLIHSIKKIQKRGMEVNGGFIVGFDSDTKSVFQNQIDFIYESGIISAMVGLLNAPKNTRLYKRLKSEGRIIKETSGNNTDFSLNFTPIMKKQDLLKGYEKIISGIYSGRVFYSRVLKFLKRFEPSSRHKKKFYPVILVAFFRSVFVLGFFDRFRVQYWQLFFWSLFNKPRLLPLAITYSVYGYHFRQVFRDVL